MKRFLLFVMTLAAILPAAGCSRETRSGIDEVGKDMARDINKGASDLDRKVEDAMD